MVRGQPVTQTPAGQTPAANGPASHAGHGWSPAALLHPSARGRQGKCSRGGVPPAQTVPFIRDRGAAPSAPGGAAGPGGASVDVLAVGGGLVEAEGVSDDGRGGLGDELAERGDPAGAHGEAEAAELVEDRGAVRDMALKFLTTNAAPAYMPIARAGPKLPLRGAGVLGGRA
jgi:hypothetical protein